MKVEEDREGSREQTVLISLITRDAVLARVASRWRKPGLFLARDANLIAGWCVTHFLKYGRAPGRAVEGYFRDWAETARNEALVEGVDKILSGISDQYERNGHTPPDELSIDEAGALFRRNVLQLTFDQGKDYLEAGEVDKAEEQVTKYARPELGVGAGIDLRDPSFAKGAFARRGQPLVVYEDGLGRFFGRALERDGFIAFCGPEKSGKTFWLLDLAWTAATQGNRVAFFEVGDMSEDQIAERFYVRAAGHPRYSTEEDGSWPCRVTIPTGLYKDGDDFTTCPETRSFNKALSWKAGVRAVEKALGTEGDLLRLACYPNFTVNVHGIQTLLEEWKRGGWTPDVVVLDYADDLSPPTGVPDLREQINVSWKQLRSLSQSLHCLVVTATQTNRDGYDPRYPLKRSNVSDDKRKLAHVTGMVGINVRDEEKKEGRCRLNWMALRGAEFTESTVVHVAGCLALANPAMASTF